MIPDNFFKCSLPKTLKQHRVPMNNDVLKINSINYGYIIAINKTADDNVNVTKSQDESRLTGLLSADRGEEGQGKDAPAHSHHGRPLSTPVQRVFSCCRRGRNEIEKYICEDHLRKNIQYI